MIRLILPALQSQRNRAIASSLKVLVLSGEVLPLSLWDMLSKFLPETTILNLYGSTEVGKQHSHSNLVVQVVEHICHFSVFIIDGYYVNCLN